MACTITLTSVTGIGSMGGVPAAIRVSGTAVECSSLNLVLRCPKFDPGTPFSGSTTVATDGTWTVDVPVPAGAGCDCGGNISVHVTCAANPSCTASFVGTFGCNGTTCPTSAWSGFSLGDCNPDGTRTVSVSAAVTGAGPFIAELRDSTPAVLDTLSTAGSLSGSGNYSGAVVFSVAFTSPPGCPGIALPVTVPPCKGNGGGGGGGSGWCLGLWIVIVAAGAIALLAVLLAICQPAASTALFIAAAIFAAIAAAAGIISAIFCTKPCGWGLLLSGQIALGAGIGAVILSSCCPWMIWVGLGIAALGLLLLLIWRSHCNMTWCELAKQITYVIGGVVLPIVGIVVLIPAILLCVNMAALAWVSAVFGPIATYAAAC